MIDIKNAETCCGCNACGDVCAKQAISFKTDSEGFWYPEVNKDLCNNCALCEKVCPQLNIQELKKNDYPQPKHTYAAVNRSMRIRWNSTSGGAYTALAETMLEQGGYVSGAIYNEGFTGVHNYVTNRPEDLEKLRSSKYLQSNAEGLYKEIKGLLVKGEKVLACGTPCQMAALRSYLRKDYENLIIVDFICRGVNSPKVYRAYLDSLEKRYNSKIVFIKAKSKDLGWRNMARKVVFENGETYYGLMHDPFYRGYRHEIFCRPSCYNCQFKGMPRMADITVADYWGIERVDQQLDLDIGTSMILLNSEKGIAYFEQAKEKLEYKETPFESVLPGNVALFESIPHAKIDRAAFFKDLEEKDFNQVADQYFPEEKASATSHTLRSALKAILRKGYIVAKYLIYALRHPAAIWNTYRINHRDNTRRTAAKKITVSPQVVLDIHPSSTINVEDSLLLGHSEIKNFWYPTALKMEANTELTIHGGPLTRYGEQPYILYTGACIEIVNGGKLTIGEGFSNVNLTIMCSKEITIGNGVRIGRNVSIRDFNGNHVILNDHYRIYAPVHIGDHCWLCTGCTIMPGVTIGEGSVVAANAVVTKDVPPHSLVAGSPAKVIKENIQWY